MSRAVNLKGLSGCLAILMLVLSAAAQDRYRVDPSHAQVGFSVRHMVLSKVRGEFKDFEIEIRLDAGKPGESSVRAVIQAASIDTGNPDRDEHLRGPDFFDAAEHPEIVFESRRVEVAGKEWIATGDLSMHGVTREVRLPFVLSGPLVDPWGKTRIGVETGLTLDRRDYDISWSKVMDSGGLVVGNEVQVEIGFEAIRQ